MSYLKLPKFLSPKISLENKMGGAGAAEHGINVFGGIGQQQPVGANDNTIATKQVAGGKRKGGSMGVDVGAPLILTGLNQYMKRRSAKKGGGKCSLKGGNKKEKMGGKSKKMMKKGKKGGKRKSMKKKGRKMRGGVMKCTDGSDPMEVLKCSDDSDPVDSDPVDSDPDDSDPVDEDDDEEQVGGDENLNVTLPQSLMSGHENHSPTLPPVTN